MDLNRPDNRMDRRALWDVQQMSAVEEKLLGAVKTFYEVCKARV